MGQKWFQLKRRRWMFHPKACYVCQVGNSAPPNHERSSPAIFCPAACANLWVKVEGHRQAREGEGRSGLMRSLNFEFISSHLTSSRCAKPRPQTKFG